MPRSVSESATHLGDVKLIKREDSELKEGEIGHSSPSVLVNDFDRISVAPGDSALHSKYLLLVNRNTTNGYQLNFNLLLTSTKRLSSAIESFQQGMRS